MKKKIVLVSLFLLSSLIFLGACASKSSGKQEIIVATDSDTAPFTYTGKDGKQTGYDIEVLKAVFKDSDKYQVKFETTAFDSILPGMDAERYQIAANDFNYNADRAKKYLFSDPVSLSNYAIVTKTGSYASLDDLSGKSTQALAGSNYAQTLEDWNKAHPDKPAIKVNYVSGDTGFTARLQALDQGKIDFIFYDQISSTYASKDQGFNFTVTPLKDKAVAQSKNGKEYYLFAKTDQGKELQGYVNKRLKALKEDGTLAKLSQKYLGGDYVSNLD